MFANLGNTLALIRHLRGKSQAQVARDAGIGRSKLSKYENGTELPGLDPLSRLLKALDISLHEFLFTLALVDERASLLSSCDASTQRSLLVIPRQGRSVMLPRWKRHSINSRPSSLIFTGSSTRSLSSVKCRNLRVAKCRRKGERPDSPTSDR